MLACLIFFFSLFTKQLFIAMHAQVKLKWRLCLFQKHNRNILSGEEKNYEITIPKTKFFQNCKHTVQQSVKDLIFLH